MECGTWEFSEVANNTAYKPGNELRNYDFLLTVVPVILSIKNVPRVTRYSGKIIGYYRISSKSKNHEAKDIPNALAPADDTTDTGYYSYSIVGYVKPKLIGNLIYEIEILG